MGTWKTNVKIYRTYRKDLKLEHEFNTSFDPKIRIDKAIKRIKQRYNIPYSQLNDKIVVKQTIYYDAEAYI